MYKGNVRLTSAINGGLSKGGLKSSITYFVYPRGSSNLCEYINLPGARHLANPNGLLLGLLQIRSASSFLAYLGCDSVEKLVSDSVGGL
jgi:hypothetical protein